jgi:hypothetical protein
VVVGIGQVLAALLVILVAVEVAVWILAAS